MEIIGVREAMTVAEIGAGNGRFAVRVAKRVGKRGRVFANDINKKALHFMRARIKRENITNMVVVEGIVDNPLLPERSVDLIYVINSYSHFTQPVALLKKAISALKTGGRLAIIEYDPRKRPDLEDHATHQETVIRQAQEAGFQLLHTDTTLPIDNIYIFRIREESNDLPIDV
jgi:ubiquinone/menaquinone biosynthesis C-methylase UbiE